MCPAEIGVVHGRFQPLHNDHMDYILAAVVRSRFLYVGITNPDPSQGALHESDLNRSLSSSNPMTYWERKLCIEASLFDAGVPSDRIAVVPFPIHCPHCIYCYVPKSARFFLTIYDDWGRHKREVLLSHAFDVEVLWERPPRQKGLTATELRTMIRRGQDWDIYVPPAVARIIRTHGIDDRIRHEPEKAQAA